MSAVTCVECGVSVPRGLATVRTTLSEGAMPVLVSVAWCRSCRPVLIPQQRQP